MNKQLIRVNDTKWELVFESLNFKYIFESNGNIQKVSIAAKSNNITVPIELPISMGIITNAELRKHVQDILDTLQREEKARQERDLKLQALRMASSAIKAQIDSLSEDELKMFVKSMKDNDIEVDISFKDEE